MKSNIDPEEHEGALRQEMAVSRTPKFELRAPWCSSWWREAFLWSLPALLLGLVLRVLLIWQLPYGIYHYDTPDFLLTPERLITAHHLEIHPKKTFLAPLVFSLPFLLHLPALLVIPLLQHLLGLASVLLTGALGRLWFARWKWFLLPLTLIAAVDPFLLWFEHTLLAETLFVFCTLLLALAGTVYTRAQTRRNFLFLCAALFLEAGARPEGKLFFGFGLLLVGAFHLRRERAHLLRLGALLLLALITHFLTRTGQGGLLLYTSVARFTPTELKCAPGFEPYIAAEREALQHSWEQTHSFPKVTDRHAIADAVENYLKDQRGTQISARHLAVNDFCLKLARETCLRSFFSLPAYAYRKFQFTAQEAPSGNLDKKWLWDSQASVYREAAARSILLARGLTGYELADSEAFRHFVETHYCEIPWFDTLQSYWLRAVNAIQLGGKSGPGLPIYFPVAAAGLLFIAMQRGPLQRFHLCWGLTLLAFFYVIMLTANVKPRFRFVFEPFWFLYGALLFDLLAQKWSAARAPLEGHAPESVAV